MFNSLKEKLKNWVKKNQEEVIEEPAKKEKKKIIKKEIIKKTVKKTANKEAVNRKEKKSREIEEEEIEKIEEKKSFFSRFKKEKKSEEEAEEVLHETEEEHQNKKSTFSKLKKEEIKPKEELELPPTEKKLGFFTKALDQEKFNELFEELEMILLQNNVAYKTVESIKKSLSTKLVGKSLKEVNLATELKKSIQELLINPPNFINQIKSSEKPFIILFAGINGSGKTTTIAKVANYLQKNKFTVCLAAADTFRAAAIQQLEEHAKKLEAPIIKKDYGADPASVGFEAIKYAKKNRIDVVLIDTAGRMQNKDSLMREIEKISRVTNPNMKIFLGESITGNDATEQAKSFNESIGLTGIILSKADVDEKGGTAISVSHITGKPILFLGTGQEYEDLEIFDKEKMIEKLGL
jgi:fused signal recognition particle receptor